MPFESGFLIGFKWPIKSSESPEARLCFSSLESSKSLERSDLVLECSGEGAAARRTGA